MSAMTDNQKLLLADEAYMYLDAAMPTVLDAVEHLGNTDASRTFWLAQKALEKAHELLKAALLTVEATP